MFAGKKQPHSISFPQVAHLARVVRTDGDTKLSQDEGVVDQLSHIFKCLPIVFTDAETKLQLRTQNTVVGKQLLFHLRIFCAINHEVFLTSCRS